MKHLSRLVAALRPVDAPSQLVHGDLTGNVLFAPGLPPAVIELLSVLAAHCLRVGRGRRRCPVWEGADESLLGAVDHVTDCYLA